MKQNKEILQKSVESYQQKQVHFRSRKKTPVAHTFSEIDLFMSNGVSLFLLKWPNGLVRHPYNMPLEWLPCFIHVSSR